MRSGRHSHKRAAVVGKWILGIDPGKERHTDVVVDPKGVCVDTAFSFPVSSRGFRETLFVQLGTRLPKAQSDNLVVAVETSCNLWKPIAAFLDGQGYTVALVSPLTTHHARPLHSHDFSRTDPKDAQLIAEAA